MAIFWTGQKAATCRLEDIDLDKEVRSTRIKNGDYVDRLREQ
jgi:hypothetical protein